MFVKTLSISKSQTLGKSINNITKFRKITIHAQADLSETDDTDLSYKLLSSFLDEQLEFEKTKYEKCK
jgi:hypothetical protein